MQLIQMRQQIRAVESIKKITQAMRLISMSSHTHLSNQALHLQQFKNELLNILSIIENTDKNLIKNFYKKQDDTFKPLIILIGSQKGLAGTFNVSLFKKLEKSIGNFDQYNFISVGKKATDYLRKKTKPLASFDNFAIKNLSKITDEISKLIIENNFTNIITFSNFPKTFFIQLPQKQIILPFDLPNMQHEEVDVSKYIWEQDKKELFNQLMNQYLMFSIHSALFNSLLAEHAARFRSMDSATRNAQEILDRIKLQYNKLRQARITSEITELSSSM